ncbi:MAG: beta-galactosidase [Bacteroidetes bacterium]|nr:beta-galactosidase [Bacteroidota bacterium]
MISSLNGSWQFQADPNSELSVNKVRESFLFGQLTGAMPVPSNWHNNGLPDFSGTVWFCTRFHQILSSFSLLEFKGVDYFADVWLNGEYLGHHEGYFQPFTFKIPDFLYLQAEHDLIIKVTSPKEEAGPVWPWKKTLIKGIFGHHDCRPGANSPEFGQDMNTGGIWNSVSLHTGLPLWIERMAVSSELNADHATTVINVQVYYQNGFVLPKSVSFNLALTHPNGSVTHEKVQVQLNPGQGSFCYTFFLKKPKLWHSWDTGSQPLYTAAITCDLCGETRVTFGIKTVSTDDKKQFFLNGKRLFLRGTNVIPDQLLSTLSNERLEAMISLMVEANINIVRVHAHVNRPEFYKTCDQKGLLVWQDFPLQWTYSDAPEFISNAVSQIKDMVRLLKNHASIAFWCCHNEPGEQIKTVDPFLVRAVLSEDSTRIVRMASNYEEHPYDGWYWGNPEHYAGTPMGPMVTEFGAQALPEPDSLSKFIPANKLWPPDWATWEYHDFQYDQTFNIAGIEKGKSINQFAANSQKYQSKVLETATEWYRRKRFNSITGVFQFMFQDCWPSITWSIVDYYGKRKSGFYSLKKAFEPVHCSVFLRQTSYLPAARLNLEIWLINDLWKDAGAVTVTVSVGKSEVGKLGPFSLSADSLIHIPFEDIKFFITENLMNEQRLIVTLAGEKGILSEFRSEIKIGEKV